MKTKSIMCAYCSEEKATDKIGDPNLDMSQDIDWGDDKNWWKVCADCREVIPLQMFSTMGGELMQKYCNEKLDAIAKRSGKPIMTACIYRKKDGSYDTVSKTFTGKE